MSPSLPEYHGWANIQLKIWALKSYIFISCRIPQVLQQTIPTWHHHFVLSKRVTEDFMFSVDERPYYKLISSIIISAISNNTQLNTFIFLILVQPDNHPPEMLHLQINFWKVDFRIVPNQCLFHIVFEVGYTIYTSLLWENVWDKNEEHPFPKCSMHGIFIPTLSWFVW